jgi:hypothetical protein
MTTHPRASELALYVGSDCGPLTRWRIARHLRRCEACRAEAASIRTSRELLRECMAEMPAGVNWERLAREMTGNIRVGLAAGACVGDFPAGRRIRPLLEWKIVTCVAMLAILLAAALVVNLPSSRKYGLMSSLRTFAGFDRARPEMPALAAPPASAVLEASPQQIGLWSNGASLTMSPRQTSDLTVSLSLQGSASEQVVDGDTGQITINQVYYAQ